MKDRRVWACALVAAGAALRLVDLGSSEFKGDELRAIEQGIRLLWDRPWATGAPWPAHGMPSSQGVANAPLLTWIVALFWWVARDPLGVTACVAALSSAALVPLYLWARRRLSGERALWVLAFAALSPFAVIYSRKVWGQCLLFPALVLLLWAVEWTRARATFWRGLAALLWVALFAGQLHQTGPILLAGLGLGFAIQWAVDRRRGLAVRPDRPRAAALAGLAVAAGANVFFWWPYLAYLSSLPPGALTSGQRLPWAFGSVLPSGFSELTDPGASHLLRKLFAQLVPVDLLWFFYNDRAAFLEELGPGLRRSLADALRIGGFWLAVATGVVLGAVGFWAWLKRPGGVPVLGIAWWAFVAIVTLVRIPCYPHYVLALAPLPALLLAGVFELPSFETRRTRALRWARGAHAAALLALTSGILLWIGGRGGAAGDYGVAYSVRLEQARALNAAAAGQAGPAADPRWRCGAPPAEATWLAGWLNRFEERPGTEGAIPVLCDGWARAGGRNHYRWVVRSDLTSR